MGGGRPAGPQNQEHWKPPKGPWQRPNKDELMRLDMCEALMAVASERPTKAQHSQELEMSIYESAPTKEIYLQAAGASYLKFSEMLKHHMPRLSSRTRGPSVKYPKAPLPGSVTALNLKSARQAAAAAAAAKAAAALQQEEEEAAVNAAGPLQRVEEEAVADVAGAADVAAVS